MASCLHLLTHPEVAHKILRKLENDPELVFNLSGSLLTVAVLFFIAVCVLTIFLYYSLFVFIVIGKIILFIHVFYFMVFQRVIYLKTVN